MGVPMKTMRSFSRRDQMSYERSPRPLFSMTIGVKYPMARFPRETRRYDFAAGSAIFAFSRRKSLTSSARYSRRIDGIIPS